MTYSLIGICPDTGMLGGIIATSSPAVGARCLFVGNAGAALSQYWTDPRLGMDTLAALEAGTSPDAALDEMMTREYHEVRQLAALTSQGAAWRSGARVAGAVSCATGSGCVAIGNILANDTIATAMVEAFCAPVTTASTTPIAHRLLAALKAGNRAGGEVKQVLSAAMKIMSGQRFPRADLRVDLSDTPIAALDALWSRYEPDVEAYERRALAPF
ncbi:DUF1028 domain-containing protein [Frigidibacter sp. MR17.24]|uniref:DUF1028 domain-containing protein n=1 Tax=Frigidibacter sp. MR17.24 TaxID=3127345 RepID=UPI00301304E7